FLAGLRDLAFDALPVLLLEDVGGAFVTGVEVGAVFGLDEVLQRPHASQKPHEVVFVPERKDRVDQVVADAGFALLDFEAVDEKRDNVIVRESRRLGLYFRIKARQLSYPDTE